MRGKLKYHADTSNALGITPADAGKTTINNRIAMLR